MQIERANTPLCVYHKKYNLINLYILYFSNNNKNNSKDNNDNDKCIYSRLPVHVAYNNKVNIDNNKKIIQD